jgi:hypothetical protein
VVQPGPSHQNSRDGMIENKSVLGLTAVDGEKIVAVGGLSMKSIGGNAGVCWHVTMNASRKQPQCVCLFPDAIDDG